MFRSLGLIATRTAQFIQPSKIGFITLPRYTFAGGKKDKKKEQKEEDAK